jgi:hypothetical protein
MNARHQYALRCFVGNTQYLYKVGLMSAREAADQLRDQGVSFEAAVRILLGRSA